jgi:sodium transport system permease protein
MIKMSNVLISWKKEIRAIFRDKKFLSIILFMPLIIPAFIIGMGALYDSLNEVQDLKIGINYQMDEDEKQLFDQMGGKIEVITKSEDELKEEYNNKNIKGYVLKDNNNYTLYLDTSSTDGMTLSEILRRHYESYNNILGAKYLVEHNIEPKEVFGIINVDLEEQAEEGRNFFTNYIISFSLIYLVMIVVVTAMNTSTDLIAGEKERGTFETLLTFPLTSNEIIGGKLLAIVTSCIISSIIGVFTSVPALLFIKNNTETFKDMVLNVNPLTIILTIISLILISCLVGVLAIFLCGRAKTFKEAQSKVSFLSFVSLIPMFTNLANVSSDILYFIPIANGGQILNDLYLSSINYTNFLSFALTSVIFTFVLLVYVSKQYKDEKALF